MADSIGIDIGSTNIKVVLLDGDLAVRASAERPLFSHQSGDVAEQDAGFLWEAVVDALRALGGQAGAGGLGDVATIGLCGQYSSIVPVDEAGRPLAPLRLYLDRRGTDHCLELLGADGAFEAWIERHPIPPVGGGLALGHLLAFQLDHPELHERTATYLEPVDYVTTRLTGRATATQGSMFASQLVDNRTLGATAYDPDLLRRSGVDPSRLPPLVRPDEVVGTVLAEVAAATGLPTTAQVRAGMTDSQAAALATGARSSGSVGIAIGTTSVVLATTPTLGLDLDHEVLSMPGVMADRYLVWAENGLAGRAVETVLSRLVHPDDALGDHGVADPFQGFESALAASPPGAGGVVFLPWLAGSLAPQADPSVRGGFLGVSLETNRVDLVRAAVEGVAHNLRWLLGPVESFTGTTFDEAVLVGGAARSPGWTQVLADVLERPVRTVVDPGRAGARAVAAWSVDPDSASTASASTDAREPASSASSASSGSRGPSPASRWDRHHEPDPTASEVHAATHQRFVDAFAALRPLRLGDPT